MTSDAAHTLAALRAKNAERQRRYRERNKDTDAFKVSNTERQRRYRERQRSLAPNVTLADRILAHVRQRPGVTAADLYLVLGADRASFLATLSPLITANRLRLSDDNRLFLSD